MRQQGRARHTAVIATAVVSLFAGVVVGTVVGTAPSAVAVPPPPNNPSDQQIQASKDHAADTASEVGRLSGLVSSTQAEIDQLNAQMELKAELANKARVDLDIANQNAADAKAAAGKAEKTAADAQGAVDQAQAKAAAFAAASFRQGTRLGSLSAFFGAQDPSDLLEREDLLNAISGSELNVIANLESARNQKANLDSAARAAVQAAQAAQQQADQAKQHADQAAADAVQAFRDGQAQLAALQQRLNAQQAQYVRALNSVAALKSQRDAYNRWLAAKKAEEARLAKIAEQRRLAAIAAAKKKAAEERAAAAAQARRIAQMKAAQRAAAERAAALQAAQQRQAQAAQARQAQLEFEREKAALATAAANSVGPPPQAQGVYYANCNAARAAGAAPIRRGSPGYRAALDTDGNGWACDAGTQYAGKNNPQVYYANCNIAREMGAAPIRKGSPGYRAALDPNGNGWACDANTKYASSVPDTAPSPQTPQAPPALSGNSASLSTGQQVVAAAEQWIGTPYAWGGGNAYGPTRGIHDGGVADSYGDYDKIGFDCSGLALYAWAQVGVSLPHYSAYQYYSGQHVSPGNLQPGDLVFYANNTSDPSTIHHVAIYAGNNMVVQAPESGSYVQLVPMYWDGFIGATRPGT